MAKYLSSIDLVQNQLLRARIENRSSDPSSGVSGQIYYHTTEEVLKYYNGSSWQSLSYASGSVTSIASTAPVKINGGTSAATGTITVTIDAASGSTSGSMSTSHFNLVNNATSNNTNSTLVLRDGSGNFSTNMIAITGTPSNPTDVATKSYVDGVATGLDVKKSVRAASVSNVSVTYSATGGTSTRGQITAAPNTLDGVSLASDDRILLKDQSTGAQNGIWVVTTLGTGSNGVWDRATDFDSDAEVTPGSFTFIEEGTANADSGWVLTNNGSITIGGASGTSLVFAQFSGAGQILAGNGLTKTGNTIDVVGTSNRISVLSDSIDISTSYVGQTSITTLGTIATGTWNGTAIGVAYGGTGLTSYTVGNLIYANGSSSLTVLAPNSGGTKQFLSMTSSTPSWGVLSNTDVPAFTGASGGGNGTTGGVPQPTTGQQNFFLRGDSTWQAMSSAAIVSVAIGSTNGGNSLLQSSTSSGAVTIDFTTTPNGNTVLASPSGGGAGAASFRSLVVADLPTVTVAKGGTGLTSVASNGILYGNGSSALQVASAGSQYQIFRAGASGVPSFGSINLDQASAVGSSILGLSNGGTNASSASTARTQLASDVSGGTLPVKVSFNLGDGSATAITVTHNLGTRDLTCSLVQSSSPWELVYADITFPTINTATVTFNAAPSTNQYRLTLIG